MPYRVTLDLPYPAIATDKAIAVAHEHRASADEVPHILASLAPAISDLVPGGAPLVIEIHREK